jgi:hypothetical protein
MTLISIHKITVLIIIFFISSCSLAVDQKTIDKIKAENYQLLQQYKSQKGNFDQTIILIDKSNIKLRKIIYNKSLKPDVNFINRNRIISENLNITSNNYNKHLSELRQMIYDNNDFINTLNNSGFNKIDVIKIWKDKLNKANKVLNVCSDDLNELRKLNESQKKLINSKVSF